MLIITLLHKTRWANFNGPPIGSNELGVRIRRLLLSVQAISIKTMLEVVAHRLDRRKRYFFAGLRVQAAPCEFEPARFLFANLGILDYERQIA